MNLASDIKFDNLDSSPIQSPQLGQLQTNAFQTVLVSELTAGVGLKGRPADWIRSYAACREHVMASLQDEIADTRAKKSPDQLLDLKFTSLKEAADCTWCAL